MILSIDSSAITASVALTDNDVVIKSEFVNAGLTHSETLLPMVKRVMDGYDYSNLNAIAVTVGPGSFTGIRIGVATVKGLAYQYNIPCYAVSTLNAIAHNFDNGIICAVMDARRMQFYNALFKIENGVVERLCDDRAISIEDLRNELISFDNVIIAGDGAKLCYDNIQLANCMIADDDKIYQNAIGVSMAIEKNKAISPNQLMPVYLRPSQAERELNLKLKK